MFSITLDPSDASTHLVFVDEPETGLSNVSNLTDTPLQGHVQRYRRHRVYGH